MRQSVIFAIAFFLFSSTTLYVVAQENKDSSQKTTSTKTETELPKSEVQLMLEDARKRGEPILGTCVEKCGENSDAQITDGVEPGRVLQLARPAYSPLARQAHISGQVQVQVIIDIDGKVIAASAISGHPLLQPASVAAARETLFTTSKYEGKPVKVVGVIAYNFVEQ